MRSAATFSLIVSLCAPLVVACAAATPGAKPHDMTMAQHERAARAEDVAANEHTARYNADAGRVQTRCSGPKIAYPANGACWTSISNPTERHFHEAEKHRKRAADHRAASQALAFSENERCLGISEEDRDESPFEHSEDIAHVEPLLAEHLSNKAAYKQTEGAVVTFRAVPGMTVPWLQRLMDCHIARNAAMGNTGPDMDACPLVPKGTTATVVETPTSFVVFVRSTDPASAKEIWRRAQLLMPPK